MTPQQVFIIGATGTVGKALVQQILGSDNEYTPIIIGLASSKEYIFDAPMLKPLSCLHFLNKKSTQAKPYKTLSELVTLCKTKNLKKVTFIDVSSGDLTEFHCQIMQQTDYKIVTANKNPLAKSSIDIFRLLTKNSTLRYNYRCSVMAGADVIPFVQGMSAIQDPLTSVQGCFSGTLGYITSELEKGNIFSDIVSAAMAKGYTEPHPRDDLNGFDVARKLLTIARTAGYNADLKDIQVEPFIPQEYFELDDVDSFLDSLKKLDSYFENKVNLARKNNAVLRYIARLDAVSYTTKPRLKVGLQEVDKNSSIGALQGISNIFVANSKTYPSDAPYILIAPGAGPELTAYNIRRDLCEQLRI